MMKHRAVLCALLAFAMMFTLCACDGSGSDESGKESNMPVETGSEASITPSDETPIEVSAAMSIPSNPPKDRPDLVILNWEKYINRPHGIQPGTALNYAANDVPSQLPWNCVAERWLTTNIYEGLLYMYMNDPADVRGCIAESWTHSADYLNWTFKVRDGVTFTDGTVCDAYAVAKSWDYVREADEYNSKFAYYNIVSWEAAGAGVFVVHMSAPCAYFETDLCGNSYLMIASPTALQVYGADDSRVAVGTGPYYIASYDEDDGYVLKASAGYYLEEKMPCIETINLKAYDFRYYVLKALTDGELDGAAFNSATNYGIGLPNRADTGPMETYNTLLNGGYGGTIVRCLGEVCPMWFNAGNVEAFKTLEVREAMCRFIDFEAINDRIYDGLGGVQDSLWARGAASYVATDWFYYDPEEGRALLASVGIEASEIQIHDEYSYYQEDIYTEIVNELSAEGVGFDVKPIHIAASFTPLGQGTWQMILYSGHYDDTRPFFSWMISLMPEYSLKLCFQNVYDPELYQKMLDEYDAMMAAATWADMAAHCRQLTAYQQDDFGAIATVQPPAFLALGSEFKNAVYFSEEHVLQFYYLYQ